MRTKKRKKFDLTTLSTGGLFCVISGSLVATIIFCYQNIWPYLFITIPLFLLSILILVLRSPKVKGAIGEKFVADFLKKNIGKDGYLINNLIISDDHNHTSQIDHVVISSKGLLVIETKNYSGRIYGNSSQDEWTQVLNFGRTKHHFYSPIKQNYTHIARLKNVLNVKDNVFSFVIFVQGNIEYINCDDVYTYRTLKKKLKKLPDKALSPEKIEEYYSVLKSYKEKPIQTNKEHVKEIKQMQKNIRNNICPRCGGQLILRHGKSGDFYGCSNYPQCKFTKKVGK